MFEAEQITQTLQQYWGHAAFRPLQGRIIQSILANRDCAVVMPTGGGKSLCYQLPAILKEGTAIVISPLIALMQDQVAQLVEKGIPAAFLNSSLSWPEQTKIISGAKKGAYRLLYLSPERIAKAETVDWLRQVPISLFAIDEAHCISEWGHEFRPEYRQLSSLRKHFPGKPIAAFTASATRRVRHDILDQLGLVEPDKYIASFHRPNLRFLVHECQSPGRQEKVLSAAIRQHSGESVIVYAGTVAKVEETAAALTASGIPAIAYHGRMDSAVRQRNQELWMADQARVLVGTLAFGLGINKASVRAVIHLALPKSLEQYYQEAGRAGRDGLDADCLLLWQKRDKSLLVHFIQQLKEEGETSRAWDRYRSVLRFVEQPACRHKQVCLHFGEVPKWTACGHCDVCCGLPAWMTTKEHRTRKASGSSQPRPRPRRELDLNAAVDFVLFEELRSWRKRLAQEKGWPAFAVMTDKALEQICLAMPCNETQLLALADLTPGRAKTYGADILEIVASFAARTSANPSS